MKQKVVIKVFMHDHKKSRPKAMKIAVSMSGVESAALKGTNKDELEVIGDGIDAAELTTLLRKNVGYAELVSVGPPASDKKKEATVLPLYWPPYTYGGVPCYQIYEVPGHETYCSIL